MWSTKYYHRPTVFFVILPGINVYTAHRSICVSFRLWLVYMEDNRFLISVRFFCELFNTQIRTCEPRNKSCHYVCLSLLTGLSQRENKKFVTYNSPKHGKEYLIMYYAVPSAHPATVHCPRTPCLCDRCATSGFPKITVRGLLSVVGIPWWINEWTIATCQFSLQLLVILAVGKPIGHFCQHLWVQLTLEDFYKIFVKTRQRQELETIKITLLRSPFPRSINVSEAQWSPRLLQARCKKWIE